MRLKNEDNTKSQMLQFIKWLLEAGSKSESMPSDHVKMLLQKKEKKGFRVCLEDVLIKITANPSIFKMI